MSLQYPDTWHFSPCFTAGVYGPCQRRWQSDGCVCVRGDSQSVRTVVQLTIGDRLMWKREWAETGCVCLIYVFHILNVNLNHHTGPCSVIGCHIKLTISCPRVQSICKRCQLDFKIISNWTQFSWNLLCCNLLCCSYRNKIYLRGKFNQKLRPWHVH